MSLEVTPKPPPSSLVAVMIGQTFAATSAGAPIGTRMLMNCTGIVIHNSTKGIGALAHVESRPDAGQYTMDIASTLCELATKLAQMGASGEMKIVLLGNSQGLKTVEYEGALSRSILREFAAYGVTPSNIMDKRNIRTRIAPPAGTWVGPEGLAGACLYDPKAKRLYTSALGDFKEGPMNGGIDHFAIQ